MPRGAGPLQRKILLLLLTGLTLSLTRSPRQYFKVLKDARREWTKINSRNLKKALDRLYDLELIEKKSNKDGTINIVLSREGRLKALIYQLDEIELKKPGKWDRKWRVVVFDIPEEVRQLRDVFRGRLKKLGFYELQKSVFVHPYDCEKEISMITEVYELKKYVRFILADYLDNESILKKYFSLV